MYRPLDLPAQHQLEAERNCGPLWTDPLLCFLCRHAGVNCGATSLFTLQSEVKLPPPPTERLLFCKGIPCLGLLWTGEEGGGASCQSSRQFRNRVRGTWFKHNCPVLSPCNEASEVIKMPSVLSRS